METLRSLEQFFTEEQKPILREWENLFDLCNNPPQDDLEIGTVIMPTGDWLDRAHKSIELFRERFTSQKMSPHLVVTGKWSHPDLRGGGAGADKVARAFRIFGQLTDAMKKRLVVDTQSANTKEQAENVYDLLTTQSINEPLVVVVSAHHLPRFYSTFVKTILTHEETLRTRLFGIPVLKDWEGDVPKEPRRKRYQQVIAETEKIHRYRPQGDVASQDELASYVYWLKSNQNNNE